jgi:hypothetical protein
MSENRRKSENQRSSETPLSQIRVLNQVGLKFGATNSIRKNLIRSD